MSYTIHWASLENVVLTADSEELNSQLYHLRGKSVPGASYLEIQSDTVNSVTVKGKWLLRKSKGTGQNPMSLNQNLENSLK